MDTGITEHAVESGMDLELYGRGRELVRRAAKKLVEQVLDWDPSQPSRLSALPALISLYVAHGVVIDFLESIECFFHTPEMSQVPCVEMLIPGPRMMALAQP